MNKSFILSADIGGSHITAAIIDLETSIVLPNTLIRSHVDAHKDAEEIIRIWSGVLQEASAYYNLPYLKIGIALPGPFDYLQGICQIQNQNKYDALYGLNVKELLARKLHVSSQDIRMINDAGSFLQGEVFAGTAKGYSHAIGVTLGTGLGTSRFHETLAEDADLWCSPFLNSIAEDYLSTRWFISRYQELSGIKVQGVKELTGLAEKDVRVRMVFEEFGTNLGKFLVDFIRIDKPEVIIIGGNIANASNLFINKVNRVLTAHNKLVPIKKSILGEEAILIGAANCWHKTLSSPLID